MAVSLESAFQDVCKVFGISSVNKFQKDAIKCIVDEKRDVFVNVPTGFGKSIIFQALPIVFSSRQHGDGVDQGQNLPSQDTQPDKHIILVVSPLNSLMKDQVTRLHSLGVSAIALTSDSIEEKVVRGYYSVVYGSLELWLGDERWRKMVSGSVYRNNVKGVAVDEAHIISHWYVMYFSKYK